MEGIIMTWHCRSCNRNFFRDINAERIKEVIGDAPKIFFCPYCNSDKIENIPDSKK